MSESRFADSRDAVPERVRALAAGAAVRPVWISAGGATYRIEGEPVRFVKWRPYGSDDDLDGEAQRLRWAHRFALVPEVLEQGSDESGSWLVTAALAGDSAISPRWKANPGTAVRQRCDDCMISCRWQCARSSGRCRIVAGACIGRRPVTGNSPKRPRRSTSWWSVTEIPVCRIL